MEKERECKTNITCDANRDQGEEDGIGKAGDHVKPCPPSVAFVDWVNAIEVKQEHVDRILSDGQLVGFRDCLADALSNAKDNGVALPIFKVKSELYVYDHKTKWVPWDVHAIHGFIDNVLRKFLRIYCQSVENCPLSEINRSMSNMNQFHQNKAMCIQITKWIKTLDF